jgi:hypothetical protein
MENDKQDAERWREGWEVKTPVDEMLERAREAGFVGGGQKGLSLPRQVT